MKEEEVVVAAAAAKEDDSMCVWSVLYVVSFVSCLWSMYGVLC